MKILLGTFIDCYTQSVLKQNGFHINGPCHSDYTEAEKAEEEEEKYAKEHEKEFLQKKKKKVSMKK